MCVCMCVRAQAALQVYIMCSLWLSGRKPMEVETTVKGQFLFHITFIFVIAVLLFNGS